MKKGKYIFVCLMLVSSFVITTNVSAHSPENVDIEYDFDSQILNSTITHITIAPNSHYVYKVEIKVNDVLYSEELYTSQPSLDTFTYSYSVVAGEGDKITVTAFCNLFGSTSDTLIVSSENNPPTTPTIEGETSGSAGTEYTYQICSSDPNDDDIIYCIDWDDGSGEVCIGPYPTGVCATASHTWSRTGTFVITVKARDTLGAESDPATLTVTMPRNRAIFGSIFELIIERFPNAFPILRFIFV
jgi:hypothetical protein